MYLEPQAVTPKTQQQWQQHMAGERVDSLVSESVTDPRVWGCLSSTLNPEQVR